MCRRTLLAFLFLARAASAASFEVGTFTQAAGASQQVTHGLGTVPVALFVWSDGNVQTSVIERGSSQAMGFFDGKSGLSLGDALADDAGTHLGSRLIAAQTLNFVSPAGVTLASAQVAGWTATALTLSWPVNDGVPRQIHYLLLGGGGVQAKVIDWLCPADAGAVTVNGVGFEPELLLNIYAGNGGITLPSGFNAVHTHFSVASTDGGWSAANYSTAATNTVIGYFSPHGVAIGGNSNLAVRGDLSATGPDGFTITFPGSVPARVLTLALRGVPFRAGIFAKTVRAAPFEQTVAATGLLPGVVLVAGVQQRTSAFLGGNHWTLGVASASASAVSARSKLPGLPTRVTGLDADGGLIANAGGDADSAVLARFDAGSFTLGWKENSVAVMDFGFLALGETSVDGDAGPSDSGTADGGSADGGSVDAGLIDAGVTDAGTDRAPDLEAPVLSVGCGCTSASALTWAAVLCALWLSVRSKVRRR